MINPIFALQYRVSDLVCFETMIFFAIEIENAQNKERKRLFVCVCVSFRWDFFIEANQVIVSW